mmetsp:Transcript_29233/g.61181  ORF Transcript_29233/g.61181 Transcript_29233/m.61181 type:complete len:132 (-) Transcript_29233:593-988(-)
MEGIGIGAQLVPAWDIFGAIVAHKALAAFALGQELLSHNVSHGKFWVSMVVFSAMTPLGVGVGWLLTTTSNENATESVTSGVGTALAGGTFLFVAVMEIIPQEMQLKEHVAWKSAALLIGFASFGILAQWL